MADEQIGEAGDGGDRRVELVRRREQECVLGRVGVPQGRRRLLLTGQRLCSAARASSRSRTSRSAYCSPKVARSAALRNGATRASTGR